MSAFGCLYVNFMHSQTSLVPDYLEGNYGKYFNAFANEFLVNVNWYHHWIQIYNGSLDHIL